MVSGAKSMVCVVSTENEASLDTEMENVKSFTRTNINKLDFTPEKSA